MRKCGEKADQGGPVLAWAPAWEQPSARSAQLTLEARRRGAQCPGRGSGGGGGDSPGEEQGRALFFRCLARGFTSPSLMVLALGTAPRRFLPQCPA